jgi:cytochrome c-type biogenesis protein CcmH
LASGFAHEFAPTSVARLVLVAGFIALAHPAFAIDPAPPFDDPVREQRYRHLIHEIRCLQCQNETIADSRADLAADMRREIREMIANGASDADVIRFLTDRYGDFVLYRPPLQANTVALWVAPIVLVGIGFVVVWRVTARHRSEPEGPNPQ